MDYVYNIVIQFMQRLYWYNVDYVWHPVMVRRFYQKGVQGQLSRTSKISPQGANCNILMGSTLRIGPGIVL